jgi:hypothetical protein
MVSDAHNASSPKTHSIPRSGGLQADRLGSLLKGLWAKLTNVLQRKAAVVVPGPERTSESISTSGKAYGGEQSRGSLESTSPLINQRTDGHEAMRTL